GNGGCERRGLLGPLEPGLTGSGPDDHVPLGVRDADEGVVERRLDVGNALRLDDLLAALGGSARFRLCHDDDPFLQRLLLGSLLLARDGAALALVGPRVRARALTPHREAPAMAQAA